MQLDIDITIEGGIWTTLAASRTELTATCAGTPRKRIPFSARTALSCCKTSAA